MKKLAMIVFSLVFASGLTACNKDPASIGIIGGADGPTAVFIASNINWKYVCGGVGIIVLVVVAIVVYRNKKKK